MHRLAPLAAAAAAGLLLLTACSSASPGASQPVGGDAASAAAAANPNIDPGSPLGGSPAPDFSLTDQFGRITTLHQFRGKVVLLDFNDSECTNVCPLTTQSMIWAKQLLGKAGDNVALLGIDANPEFTKVADVMGYSRAHQMVGQWDFLTGTVPQLTRVWKAYKIAVQIQQGLIDHTPALYVIDQQGRQQMVYLTQMAYSSVGQSAQIIAQEVASLLPGHPVVRSTQSLAYITGKGPAAQVSLPAAASSSAAPVSFGPGTPHMVMFFATWLSETSDLRTQLRQANAYQAYAVQHHLPELTGVDEVTTEPSAHDVKSYLAPLGLRYPVALDTDGRVGDGYQVQDLPWFALVNAAGKIVWTHDGWPALAAMEQAASRA